jgi:hypothetical protein
LRDVGTALIVPVPLTVCVVGSPLVVLLAALAMGISQLELQVMHGMEMSLEVLETGAGLNGGSNVKASVMTWRDDELDDGVLETVLVVVGMRVGVGVSVLFLRVTVSVLYCVMVEWTVVVEVGSAGAGETLKSQRNCSYRHEQDCGETYFGGAAGLLSGAAVTVVVAVTVTWTVDTDGPASLVVGHRYVRVMAEP